MNFLLLFSAATVILAIVLLMARDNLRRKTNINSQQAIIVGAVIIAFLGIVSSPQNFIFLAIFSVVCTAGFSLLIWIPLCYTVGLVTIYLYRILTGKQVVSAASSLTPDQQSVINYIKQAQKHGLTKSTIVTNLESKNWPQKDIDVALKHTKLS